MKYLWKIFHKYITIFGQNSIIGWKMKNGYKLSLMYLFVKVNVFKTMESQRRILTLILFFMCELTLLHSWKLINIHMISLGSIALKWRFTTNVHWRTNLSFFIRWCNNRHLIRNVSLSSKFLKTFLIFILISYSYLTYPCFMEVRYTEKMDIQWNLQFYIYYQSGFYIMLHFLFIAGFTRKTRTYNLNIMGFVCHTITLIVV